jgi:hypothetical protein
MRTLVASALVLAIAALLGATRAAAASDALRSHASPASDLSSQDASPQRARTRIRVTPARKLVRECSFRLVREVSARGTYIVPHQRCWWARH